MEDNICENCGAKIVEYKHGLSNNLMGVLYKVILLCDEWKNSEFEIKDVDLNYNQRCNFQKLRYWELIEKVGDFDGKGGTWKLTEKGSLFAQGKLALPKFAITYRGKVISYEGSNVGARMIDGGWKIRPEYAKTAILHKKVKE